MKVVTYPTEPTTSPKFSPFKFLPSVLILALERGLAGAVKISNLYPEAGNLHI